MKRQTELRLEAFCEMYGMLLCHIPLDDENRRVTSRCLSSPGWKAYRDVGGLLDTAVEVGLRAQ